MLGTIDNATTRHEFISAFNVAGKLGRVSLSNRNSFALETLPLYEIEERRERFSFLSFIAATRMRIEISFIFFQTRFLIDIFITINRYQSKVPHILMTELRLDMSLSRAQSVSSTTFAVALS